MDWKSTLMGTFATWQNVRVDMQGQGQASNTLSCFMLQKLVKLNNFDLIADLTFVRKQRFQPLERKKREVLEWHSRGHEHQRCEPLGGSGGMLPRKSFENIGL